jgi:hypothetical protein
MGLACQILHPACEEPPFTTEIRIGDVSLLSGQAMRVVIHRICLSASCPTAFSHMR